MSEQVGGSGDAIGKPLERSAAEGGAGQISHAMDLSMATNSAILCEVYIR